MPKDNNDVFRMFLKDGENIPERRCSNRSAMWMSNELVEDAQILEQTNMPPTQYGKSLEKIKDLETGKGVIKLTLRQVDDNDPYSRD